MCEQLGTEPDPAKMPVSMDIFPEEVQYAFLVFRHLPDRWEGMSGTYMGKDWSTIDFFLKFFDIEERKIVVFFISKIEGFHTESINETLQRKRKAEQRKAKAGGKQYTHNVQG
jgi:hypothetical protein